MLHFIDDNQTFERLEREHRVGEPSDIARRDGFLRIVDESGEDYLYPETYFLTVELPDEARAALTAAPSLLSQEYEDSLSIVIHAISVIRCGLSKWEVNGMSIMGVVPSPETATTVVAWVKALTDKDEEKTFLCLEIGCEGRTTQAVREALEDEGGPSGLDWFLFLFLALSAPLAVAQDNGAAFDPYPLRPADTSSPRHTLRSFNESMTNAARAFYADEPEAEIARALRPAHESFDFSQLPERGRDKKEFETILLLKSILDRIDLPPEEDIPGDEAVADEENPLTRWAIPNTRITITKVEEGPRAGEFLFNAETVDGLEQFYELAKHLPYKRGLVGLYEGYLHRPGRMVPRSWTAALPAWSTTVVLGTALWKWLGFVIVVVAAFFLVHWLLRSGRRWDERHESTGVLLRFGLPFSVVASIAILCACRYVLLSVFRLVGEFGTGLSFLLWTLIFTGVGWFISLTASRIADVINDARQVRESSIDGQLVRIFLRLISLVILVSLVIYAANFFGIPLTPVLAGLGVGGLAIALAVRPTLENVIGGLTLFADKPVRIGDFCRFGDDYATVEEIGLRSTRLRKLDDTVVSLPNADFSQRELTNYARRRRWLYRTTLGLRYETTAEQLRYVMAKLREMLLGHPKVSPDFLHVRFDGFGAYSLDVEIFAYIRTREWLNYRAIREDINLRIVDIVKEAGTGFAFPSQTAYLGRDAGLDAERGREAETQVQAWRSKGQLPFPEFDEGLSEEKEDVLDYPPEGSPDYKLRAGSSTTPQAPPTVEPKSTSRRFGLGAKRG